MLDFAEEAQNTNMGDIPEICTFMEIVGLRYDYNYSTESQRKTLRYGKVMLLTDQNVEGSNFKGLVIYFIYSNWPQLLRLPFLEEFITPVVKARKGDISLEFYSFDEFEEWKCKAIDSRDYDMRHYIGLGTNTLKEVKEYFVAMESHRVTFKYNGLEDDLNLIKAFDKDAIEQRRKWLTSHMNKYRRWKTYGMQDTDLYSVKKKELTFSDFINSEYVFFANFDNCRSIPSVTDGLTPGQRKVLYTCIRRKYEFHVKVVQLACAVAETAAYYEGELTICKIIYSMAQNYLGSNNINLLIPIGQFGTRLMDGKDCADYHSTYTMMSKLARMIFHPHDDPLLLYNTIHDGQKIEPDYYLPVIPMLLVNGYESTGTGWSTNIPKHDPHQLIRSIRNMINGNVPEVLVPHYQNYRGRIVADRTDCFISFGCVAILDGDKIEITELPIGVSTTSYKENVLDKLIHGCGTTEPIITDFKEFHTDATVRFVITLVPGELEKLRKEIGGLHRRFKLYGIFKTDNMHAFDSNNMLRRYVNTNEILREFYHIRSKCYTRRREYLEKKLAAEVDKLTNQAKFIRERTSNKIEIGNRNRKDVIDTLVERGYQPDPVEKWKRENGIEINDNDIQIVVQHYNFWKKKKIDVMDYDYLLDMPIRMLITECEEELTRKRDRLASELSALKTKSANDLWLSDLDALENELYDMQKKERTSFSNYPGIKDAQPSENGEEVKLIITDAFINKLLPAEP